MKDKEAGEKSSTPNMIPDNSRIKDIEKRLHEDNLRIMAEFYGIEFTRVMENYRKTA